MTDRKLLELAAKAAGIYEAWPNPAYEVDWNGDGLWCCGEGRGELWNPLTDDGDALRLAVKLQIQVTPGTYNKEEYTAYNSARHAEAHERLSYLQDGCAATRRAIVRAAAAIGASQGARQP